MNQEQYIREIKTQLATVHGFKPIGAEDGVLVFDVVPDGIYPVTIEGEIDEIKIENGTIFSKRNMAQQSRETHKPHEHTANCHH